LFSGVDKVLVFTAVFRRVLGHDRSPVQEVPTIIPRYSQARGVNLKTELSTAKKEGRQSSKYIRNQCALFSVFVQKLSHLMKAAVHCPSIQCRAFCTPCVLRFFLIKRMTLCNDLHFPLWLPIRSAQIGFYKFSIYVM
jgi:hypothetical protein